MRAVLLHDGRDTVVDVSGTVVDLRRQVELELADLAAQGCREVRVVLPASEAHAPGVEFDLSAAIAHAARKGMAVSVSFGPPQSPGERS